MFITWKGSVFEPMFVIFFHPYNEGYVLRVWPNISETPCIYRTFTLFDLQLIVLLILLFHTYFYILYIIVFR